MSSRDTLKCDYHMSQGMFRHCGHWELASGETLEVRIGPTYCSQPVDVIMWEPPGRQQTKGVRVGTTWACDTLRETLAALVDDLVGLLVSERDEKKREIILETAAEISRLSDEIVSTMQQG